MKLHWEKYQAFATEHGLKMRLISAFGPMTAVRVEGVDGGLDGVGDCLQAAIFNTAQQISGKKVNVNGKSQIVPVLVS